MTDKTRGHAAKRQTIDRHCARHIKRSAGELRVTHSGHGRKVGER